MSDARALWYVGGGRVEARDVALPANAAGHVSARAVFSALSRGTERLVFEGRVPTSEYNRMRCPHQEGAFPFPVKYGYAWVGETEGGRRIFALHPHQDRIVVPATSVHFIPDGVPSRRATLAANAETALNTVWDARIGPGDRVLIVGGGVLGLLIARIAANIPGVATTVCDVDATRADVVRQLGAAFASPDVAPGEQDAVIHTSATAAGLDIALRAAGVEARVVEASWHGAGAIPVPLGADFHALRLQLISSQVGAIPADRRARWSNARRLATALELLKDDAFDAIITAEISFADAPQAIPKVLARGAPGLATVIRY